MKTTSSNNRPLTLAMVLTILLSLVEQVNKINYKKNTFHWLISEDILNKLRKEFNLMSSDNDYMYKHICLPIDTINKYYSKKTTLWLEEFVYYLIIGKTNSKFLTFDEWEHIYHQIFQSDISVTSFKDKTLKVWSTE